MGLTGVTRVVVAQREAAIIVPSVAVRRSERGLDEVVVCALEDGKVGKAVVREVGLGVRLGAEVEVLLGLKPGELVVSAHMLGLEEGRAITLGAAAP